jgi:hypothetical protein
MKLQQACRKHAKIKMGLLGPSGSGKTYSALLLAYGICDDWRKIALIDTENYSSDLYAHLGNYQVLHLEAPFSPERYIEAITVCEQANVEVIIIDSMSMEWSGSSGILETHALMPGNSFTAWQKLTPRHNAFLQRILQSPVHVIATIRSKQEYVLADKNGKQVPEKVGMAPIQRDGVEYDLTLLFELNMKNQASATKDRTSLFIGKPEFIISPKTGEMILQWCNEGVSDELSELKQRIKECKTYKELSQVYYANPRKDDKVKQLFSERKSEMMAEWKELINSKINPNGTSHNQDNK